MQNQIRRTRNVRQSLKEVVRGQHAIALTALCPHLEGAHFVWVGEIYKVALCSLSVLKLDEALLLAAQSATVKPKILSIA